MTLTHRTTRGIWFHSLALPLGTTKAPVLSGCSVYLPSGTEIILAADYGSRFLVKDGLGRMAYTDPDDFERNLP